MPNAHPERNVLVEGHTDNVGPEAYNQNLSLRRADAVRSYLSEEGVAEHQVCPTDACPIPRAPSPSKPGLPPRNPRRTEKLLPCLV